MFWLGLRGFSRQTNISILAANILYIFHNLWVFSLTIVSRKTFDLIDRGVV